MTIDLKPEGLSYRSIPWRDLYYEKIEALMVPLIAYGDEEWIPLVEFSKDLGIPADRFRKAAQSPRNHGRVRTICWLGARKHQLAVSRATLMHLVHRLNPGTNNALLRLTHCAEQISTPLPAEEQSRRALEAKFKIDRLLEREAHARRQKEKKAALLAKLITEFDQGKPMPEIEQEWVRESNCGTPLLHKALRGSLTTGTGQMAYAMLPADSPKERRIHTSNGQTKGRRAKLTTEVIVAMLDAAAAGADRRTLAARFKTSEEIVKAILKKRYSTSSMRMAVETIKSRPC